MTTRKPRLLIFDDFSGLPPVTTERRAAIREWYQKTFPPVPYTTESKYYVGVDISHESARDHGERTGVVLIQVNADGTRESLPVSERLREQVIAGCMKDESVRRKGGDFIIEIDSEEIQNVESNEEDSQKSSKQNSQESSQVSEGASASDPDATANDRGRGDPG